jgi:hypothetical protein
VAPLQLDLQDQRQSVVVPVGCTLDHGLKLPTFKPEQVPRLRSG